MNSTESSPATGSHTDADATRDGADRTSTPTGQDPTAGADRVLGPAEQLQAAAGIGTLIQDHCVFTDVAARCAALLAAYTPHPQGVMATRFADELTRELRVFDRHFTVTWGPPAALPLFRPRDAARTPVSFRQDGDIGVLSIRFFDDPAKPDAAALVRDGLERLNGSEGAVLDLRQNPGGWPAMVERVVGPLLGPEPVHIVTFHSRGEPAVESWSSPEESLQRLASMPLSVVVDATTASAAESCTYVLQTTGRATIVGVATAGAANPVELVTGSDGFSVYTPTGAPVDPRTGTNWDLTGIRPDIEADTTDALAVAVAHVRSAAAARGEPGR